MVDASGAAQRLCEGVQAAGPTVIGRLTAVTALSSEERLILEEATEAMSDDVADLTRRLLREWDRLSAVERTAALLALAEALGGVARPERCHAGKSTLP